MHRVIATMHQRPVSRLQYSCGAGAGGARLLVSQRRLVSQCLVVSQVIHLPPHAAALQHVQVATEEETCAPVLKVVAMQATHHLAALHLHLATLHLQLLHLQLLHVQLLHVQVCHVTRDLLLHLQLLHLQVSHVKRDLAQTVQMAVMLDATQTAHHPAVLTTRVC